MQSLTIRAFTGAALLLGSAVVCAQQPQPSFDQPIGYQQPVEMVRTFPTYGIGSPQAEPSRGGYVTKSYHEHPAGEDDTVSCMAIGCPGSPYPAGGERDHATGPYLEFTQSQEDGLIADLQRRVKEDKMPAQEKPETERGARDEYYRQLHRHADGKGTIEDVEEAYRDLVRYRR